MASFVAGMSALHIFTNLNTLFAKFAHLFDPQNKNLLSEGAKTFSISTSQKESSLSAGQAGENAPPQLFDIRLELERSELHDPSQLIALSASDGPSGLAVALREKPDIILLDIMMPGFDGMALMKNLRQAREQSGQENEWGKHVPIILLTSLSADDKIMIGIIRDEPAYYIVKDNFSLDDIVEKVKERLERV